ncbi:MAG TPA: DNA internalization-related competence protein ComEC/Rec2, partial [Fibrobacteraceae bacterium]|nr:DNA internalization-related competence protein ComEC/Rec2 [Fibrobacteraceae bacterium]
MFSFLFVLDSWCSALAVILVVCLIRFCSIPEAVFLVAGVWCGALYLAPRPSRRIFLVFSLLMAFRMWMVQSVQLIAPEDLPRNGVGEVRSLTRTSSGFRIQVFLEGRDAVFLRIPASENPPLPGDQIRCSARWDALRPLTVPGSFDVERWLLREGCVASGSLLDWSLLRSSWSVERWAWSAREWLRHLCQRYMAVGTDGVLVALLVGDKSGLDPEVGRDFRSTGLVHILTVSGFHVVFLSHFLCVFLAAMRIPLRHVRWLSVILLLAFVPVAGSSPAVQRAVLMFFFMQFGHCMERPPHALHILGVTVTLLLLMEPGYLLDVGFQLSCGATAGILLGQRRCSSFPRWVPGWLHTLFWEPTWTTLCAMAGTLPLLVLYFQSFSPVAFAGNLVVAPLMGLAMEGGFFLILGAAIPPLAMGFGQSASLLIHLAIRITEALANLPGAVGTVGPWPAWLAVLVMAGFLCLLPCRAPRWFAWVALSLWAGYGLWDCAWPLWNDAPFHVWFLDCGQGDATLLRFPSGRTVLVDAGNGERNGSYGRQVLVPFLRSQGIQRLDALVITHPDLDHYGGAWSLLENFPVCALWLTSSARLCEKNEWNIMLAQVSAQGIPITTLHEGLTVYGLGIWQMEWIHAGETLQRDDWNATSASLKVTGPAGPSLVMTGDLGEAGELELIRHHDLRAKALKIGHHGSAHSSSLPFLEAVQPQMAFISSGIRNRYHHPSPRVTGRLDSLQIPWINTAHQGSVHLIFHQDGRLEAYHWWGKRREWKFR